MPRTIRYCLFASALLISAVSRAEPLAMPERAKTLTPVPVKQVQQEIEGLNAVIGSYPPKITSDAHRATVYAQWSGALQQAWLVEAAAPETETTVVLLSELYRQGHNLDVKESGARALQTIDKCLSAFPASVACHFSASYFFLSINPAYAPRGEASLIRLRELLKPVVDPNVENGFVYAYIYQGQTDKALKQIDYLLTLYPTSEWARKLRDGIVNGSIKVERR